MQHRYILVKYLYNCNVQIIRMSGNPDCHGIKPSQLSWHLIITTVLVFNHHNCRGNVPSQQPWQCTITAAMAMYHHNCHDISIPSTIIALMPPLGSSPAMLKLFSPTLPLHRSGNIEETVEQANFTTRGRRISDYVTLLSAG